MSKYRRWYDDLIDRSRDRSTDAYCGRHHVVPRSLGGGDVAGNIVRLTYREHFLAHWLLVRMTSGADKRKMQHALSRMSGQHAGRVVAGWQYDVARRAQRDARLGRKSSLQHRQNIAAGLAGNKNAKGFVHGDGVRQKTRVRMSGNKHSLGFKHAASTLKKRGAATKAAWSGYSQEQRTTRVARMKAGFAAAQAKKNEVVRHG